MYIVGDLHGSMNHFNSLIKDLDADWGNTDPHKNYVLCLGDVGLEYGSVNQSQLRKAMDNSGYTWIVLRGNHDTRYWRDHLGQYGWSVKHIQNEVFDINFLVQDKYPNIWYLKDTADTFTYCGKNCLYVPGGFSIDGEYRMMSAYPFEYDELLTFAECNEAIRLAEENQCDYIFTHVAPKNWEPHFKDLFLSFIDQSKIDKSMEHTLDQVVENVEWKGNKCHWFFGHYHADRDFNPSKNIAASMLYYSYKTI